MASAVIHICVAKKLNEKLKRNEKMLFLGSIAPDLGKIVEGNKFKSHFLTTSIDNVPNTKAFYNKYEKDITKDFELGYFIHLYTDKLWFHGFIDKLVLGDNIHLLDGSKVVMPEEVINNLVYNDYTNLNIQLIDHYNLDLSLFYEDVVQPETKIDEIPIDKLPLLVDKMGIIIENTIIKKEYLFDITSIINFIEEASDIIYDKLIELEIIKK